MALEIFPDLPGLEIDVGRDCEWSTGVQEAHSGKETRIAFWSAPRWGWTLKFEFLRAATVLPELQSLFGFICRQRGSWGEFAFRDPNDNAVAGQSLGIGDGVKTTFQIVRTWGGFSEPCREIEGAPSVYLNGLRQLSGWTLSATGQIVFGAAPAAGVAVTVDASYLWRVRFEGDKLSASRLFKDFWECRQVKLRGIK